MARHVVPSREVYHLWANEAQDEARNSQGSVSFDGASAYSYRAIIGRIVHNKRKGRAFLVSLHTWSVTTSKHQGYLRSAIPEGERVFGVSDLDTFDSPIRHKERIADYKERITIAALRAKRARKTWNIESAQTAVTELSRELADYCAYFGLRAPKVNVEAPRNDLEALKAREREEIRTREERQNKRIEELRVEWAAMVPGWQNGTRAEMPRGYPDTLLRAVRYGPDNPQVETSRGARVSYGEARALFLFWINGNVKPGDKVGPYTVSQVDDGNAITIGCHVITMAEARRFAIQEEWIKAA